MSTKPGSIHAIARQLSCSRETVRRYIRSPLPVADIRYKPRAPRPCKLDPFKPYILERVAAARRSSPSRWCKFRSGLPVR
ncbi:hypothetical protein WKI72_11270 [Candidatus Erwinia dacicola]